MRPRFEVKWYRKAANLGDPTSQNILGELYAEGKGITQNHKEAARWFRAAAEQGSVEAQRNLGVLYALGEGVARDYKKAFMWFIIATETRDMKAKELENIVKKRTTFWGKSKAQKLAKEWMEKHRQ